MNKYCVLLPRAIRRGKSMRVEAETPYGAAKKVADIFRLRSTGDLTVILLEVDGRPISFDTTTLGS